MARAGSNQAIVVQRLKERQWHLEQNVLAVQVGESILPSPGIKGFRYLTIRQENNEEY